MASKAGELPGTAGPLLVEREGGGRREEKPIVLNLLELSVDYGLLRR